MYCCHPERFNSKTGGLAATSASHQLSCREDPFHIHLPPLSSPLSLSSLAVTQSITCESLCVVFGRTLFSATICLLLLSLSPAVSAKVTQRRRLFSFFLFLRLLFKSWKSYEVVWLSADGRAQRVGLASFLVRCGEKRENIIFQIRVKAQLLLQFSELALWLEVMGWQVFFSFFLQFLMYL